MSEEQKESNCDKIKPAICSIKYSEESDDYSHLIIDITMGFGVELRVNASRERFRDDLADFIRDWKI